MSSWQTTPAGRNPLKPSLVERAKKRITREGKSPNVYVVEGNPALGDHYDAYLVQDHDGVFSCDCQNPNRPGSEYRRTCSHITGVILHQREHGAWRGPVEAEEDPERETEPDFLELVPPPSEPDPARKAQEPPIRWKRAEDAEPDFEMAHYPLAVVPETDEIKENQEEIEEEEPEESGFDVEEDESDLTLPTKDGLLDLEDSRLWEILEEEEYVPLPSEVQVHKADPPLPEKFHLYRPDQWRAILEIEAALENGYKVVFVSAPTGSGKTLIAESVRKFRGVRGIYTCTTKTLQHQVLEEFQYAKVLKGRSNYPTLDNPQLTALDCTKEKKRIPACQNCPGWSSGSSWGIHGTDDEPDEEGGFHCNWCHPWNNCPYQVAKREAGLARLAVLNTAYFLAETNYVRNSLFRGRELVLIDEADLLEEELMRFIEVTITARDRKLLGVGLPEKKSVHESWVDWIALEVIPAIKKVLGTVDLSPDLFGNPKVEEVRRKKRLIELLQKVRSLLEQVEDEDGNTEYTLNSNWVYTGYEKDWRTGNYPPDDKVSVTFKPVHVRDYAPGFLWSKAKQFVLLSATLISPAQMAYDLGLEDDEWTVVEVPSSFPILQRPIIPKSVVSVSRKTEEQAIPLLVEASSEILEEHPDDRILIHSVSYRLTKELYFGLRNAGFAGRLVTYLSSQEREAALSRYLSASNGVLIAPSFDRGVDLPADDCRVIVVAKVPYLSLGDKQVSARLYGTGRAGRVWYAVQAIRTLCQMTGRGMRSAEDWCRTYVLDRQFADLYSQNRKLFPGWWADAIVWDINDPKWKEMV